MRAFVATLVFLASLVGLGVAAPPAQADLWDNCISYTEWNSLSTGTMHDFEARYGVTGFVVWMGNNGTTLVKQYRWCGYDQHSVYVQVGYLLNVRGQWVAKFATKFDFRGYPLAHHPFNKDSQWGG